MPTRKISELPETKQCRDSNHYHAKTMYFPPGVWEHECPTCGARYVFTVRAPTLRASWAAKMEEASGAHVAGCDGNTMTATHCPRCAWKRVREEAHEAASVEESDS